MVRLTKNKGEGWRSPSKNAPLWRQWRFFARSLPDRYSQSTTIYIMITPESSINPSKRRENPMLRNPVARWINKGLIPWMSAGNINFNRQKVTGTSLENLGRRLFRNICPLTYFPGLYNRWLDLGCEFVSCEEIPNKTHLPRKLGERRKVGKYTGSFPTLLGKLCILTYHATLPINLTLLLRGHGDQGPVDNLTHAASSSPPSGRRGG